MKKIVLALTAIAALTGSASAADMARPYTKAPVVAAAPSLPELPTPASCRARSTTLQMKKSCESE